VTAHRPSGGVAHYPWLEIVSRFDTGTAGP